MPFVRELLEKARGRLVHVDESTPLLDVIKLLHAGTDIVAVRGNSGALAGILTKTDIVELFALAESLDGSVAAAAVMKRGVMQCRVEGDLHALWVRMNAKGFKNVPVIDERNRPIGMVNARDALQTLLEHTELEEGLLRDYVMGVGYH